MGSSEQTFRKLQIVLGPIQRCWTRVMNWLTFCQRLPNNTTTKTLVVLISAVISYLLLVPIELCLGA